jgi:hypothetical protein
MTSTLIAQWNNGMDPEFFSPDERAELRRLFMSQPEYFDAKHPLHAAAVHDVRALHEADALPPEAE